MACILSPEQLAAKLARDRPRLNAQLVAKRRAYLAAAAAKRAEMTEQETKR